MIIQYYGHACFRFITRDGTRILIDPFESGGFGGRISYPRILDTVDLVFITHDHLDHSHIRDLRGNFEVIRKSGSYGKIEVYSVPAFHDKMQGQKFGGVVDMKCFEADGYKICHMGDIGDERLTSAQREQLGEIDLLILPVGGFYTIDGEAAYQIVQALRPKCVIPCHYKTKYCTLPIEGPEKFLAHFERKVLWKQAQVEWNLKLCESETTCLYFDIF